MEAQKQAILLFVTLAAVTGICSAVTIPVGGIVVGWNLPPTPTFYSNWSSQHNFHVGDVLEFIFPPEIHTVAKVSKSEYDSCNAGSNPSLLTSVPVNVTLKSTGKHYFICTILGHCADNMKLAVTVTGSSGSLSPALSPSMSPITTIGEAQPPPPDPSKNFASPAAGVSLLSLVAVAAAAFLL